MSTYIALAVIVFGCCAGCVLVWKARSMLAWRLPFRWAVLGQVGIVVAAFLAAMASALAAHWFGLLDGAVLFALGLAVFLFVWQAGLEALIARFAGSAANPKLLDFRLRRLRWASSLTMVWLGFGVGVAAFALLNLTGTPVVRLLQAHEEATRALAGAASDPAPAPVPARATRGKPSARPPAAAAARDRDPSQVISAVHAWARAWARRDVARYLGFYAPQFKTPKGESRRDWEAVRRQRIERAGDIAVRIDSPEVVFADAKTATIRFVQHYKLNSASETTRKILMMTYIDGEWRILEERGGEK